MGNIRYGTVCGRLDCWTKFIMLIHKDAENAEVKSHRLWCVTAFLAPKASQCLTREVASHVSPVQAISEYRKARSLMDSMDMPSGVGTIKPHSVWHRLFAEAEQVALIKTLDIQILYNCIYLTSSSYWEQNYMALWILPWKMGIVLINLIVDMALSAGHWWHGKAPKGGARKHSYPSAGGIRCNALCDAIASRWSDECSGHSAFPDVHNSSGKKGFLVHQVTGGRDHAAMQLIMQDGAINKSLVDRSFLSMLWQIILICARRLKTL